MKKKTTIGVIVGLIVLMIILVGLLLAPFFCMQHLDKCSFTTYRAEAVFRLCLLEDLEEQAECFSESTRILEEAKQCIRDYESSWYGRIVNI